MYKSNVNLNLYKNFYEVAKWGSFSKAAQENFVSQPALSKSIKNLELELDTQLFYRNSNGVELTDNGRELLYFVEKSYNNLIIAERNMIETENLERGKLSIGMPSNVGSFFLFDKIIEFHKDYPNIEITVITGGTSNLVNLLDSHKVDFVIDTSPIDVKLDEGIKIKKLKEVRYCFIAKKNTKIIPVDKIRSVSELKRYPLILPIPDTANRKDLDELLKNNNVKVENIINIHTSEMIISAVKKDLGIGYIISNLVTSDVENDELDILNIKEELPTVMINLLYNNHYLTKAPKRFIEKYMNYKID